MATTPISRARWGQYTDATEAMPAQYGWIAPQGGYNLGEQIPLGNDPNDMGAGGYTTARSYGDGPENLIMGGLMAGLGGLAFSGAGLGGAGLGATAGDAVGGAGIWGDTGGLIGGGSTGLGSPTFAGNMFTQMSPEAYNLVPQTGTNLAGGGGFSEQLAQLEAGLSPQTGLSAAGSGGLDLGGGSWSLKDIAGLAGPAANLIGGLFGANAAKRAGDIQAGAADRATQAQLEMYGNTQKNLAPWLGQGVTSLNQIRDLTSSPNSPLLKPFGLEDFNASPAYNFNLQEGQRAIDNAARARQTYYAPATMRDIAKYSQGQASNEFQNAYSNYNTNMGNIWNRLYSLSSGGQNAASNLGAFGTTVGSQIGQNIQGAGNAQAAGTVGGANALGQGLSGAYNTYLTGQILGNLQRPTY